MESPIILDNISDVLKIIPKDEILQFKVWAPKSCESEWGCLDREKKYLCHDLDGVMVCREWWPPPPWMFEEPEREPPWSLIRKWVPYRWLSASCCGVEAELTIPVPVRVEDSDNNDDMTIFLPLIIVCRRGKVRVRADIRELEERYRDSIVDAVRKALREVWRRTVKLLFYEMVDYDMIDIPEPISVVEWRPNVETKFVVVPCRCDGAVTVELPIQAIIDTVREHVQLVRNLVRNQ